MIPTVAIEEIAEPVENQIETVEATEAVPEMQETIVEEPTGVEVISVVWAGKEKRGKFYLYDPNGETVENGDIVLVPSFDQARNREIVREAIVAEGNHRVDPEALTRSPKKIISVVRRQADIALIEEQKKAAEVNPTETALQAEPVNTPAPAKGLARYLPWLRRK